MFNWQFEDIDSAMPYTLSKIEGQEAANMLLTPPEAKEMPPMWGSYIKVENADKSVKQCESHGSQIIVDLRVTPKVGRFCVISNPQGAVLTIITYDQNE